MEQLDPGLVHRLGRNNQEIQKGTVPNRSRAEQLASDQAADKIKRAESSEGRSSFFRRRSARRSKSFSRDRSHHRWQDSLDGLLSTKFPGIWTSVSKTSWIHSSSCYLWSFGWHRKRETDEGISWQICSSSSWTQWRGRWRWSSLKVFFIETNRESFACPPFERSLIKENMPFLTSLLKPLSDWIMLNSILLSSSWEQRTRQLSRNFVPDIQRLEGLHQEHIQLHQPLHLHLTSGKRVLENCLNEMSS